MADLGGAQISALLESVPGIANVLRSPVANAIVNTIRAGAGISPFDYADAEELVQFAVRRGLIGGAEGEQVLEDVRRAGKGGRAKRAKKTAPKTVVKVAKKTTGTTKAAKKTVGQKRAKKTATTKRAAKATKRPVKRR